MLGLNGRKIEPRANPLPASGAVVTPEVAAFIDSSARQREELAYFKTECATLENEVKVANERIRMLEAELTDVREDRDFLQRHDTAMLTSLHNIKVVIVAAVESAKAQAFAPPGSGTDRTAETQSKIDDAVGQLAAKLAPEPATNA